MTAVYSWIVSSDGKGETAKEELVGVPDNEAAQPRDFPVNLTACKAALKHYRASLISMGVN